MAKGPKIAPRVSGPELQFEASWPRKPFDGNDSLLDASVGRLRIVVAGVAATAFRTDKGDTGDELYIPLFHVADWIAANWWPLLFEPRKNDRSEDDDCEYRSRHWLGTARNGFPLPDLWLSASGEKIEITARPTYLRFSRLTFTNEIAQTVPTPAVKAALWNFVSEVAARLAAAGQANTSLHHNVEQIRNTPEDAEEFCRLMGALGLSPYEEHPEIEQVLDRLADMLAPEVLRDLCEAADSTTFIDTTERTEWALRKLDTAIDLSPIIDIEFPDDTDPAAWRWGIEAVRRVRRQFGISSKDPNGSAAFFEKLGIRERELRGESFNGSSTISGAVERRDATAKVGLLDEASAQRRFTMARAAFLGWSSQGQRYASRLITGARTRDQQASRAFAAELLAPADYIRSKASPDKVISGYRVGQIAKELGVSPAVVQYQAENNRLYVHR